QVFVQTKRSKLRSGPAPLARVLQEVRYGDALEALGEQDGWVRVRAGRTEGFVHKTAITPKRVVLSPSSPAPSGNAQGADVVIAGKGFSREVEQQYASQNRGLNFSAVDEMERRTVADAELAKFIAAGALTSREK
ncbi:MAG: SH3 domain-containing protein, partial [Bdellovibrionales bacterium]|nr:SH3 domain-containing protein [Bdellovibrionales bacterium]